MGQNYTFVFYAKIIKIMYISNRKYIKNLIID